MQLKTFYALFAAQASTQMAPNPTGLLLQKVLIAAVLGFILYLALIRPWLKKAKASSSLKTNVGPAEQPKTTAQRKSNPVRIAILCMLLIASGYAYYEHGSTFSENEARNAFAAAIQEGSQGKITVISFKKTDGQKSEANGIRIYRFDFEAQIQFEANGSWLKGMAMDSRLSFQFAAPVNTGSWAAFNNQMQGGIAVSQGARATISGSVLGQKTENGWKLCHRALQNRPPPGTFKPARQLS